MNYNLTAIFAESLQPYVDLISEISLAVFVTAVIAGCIIFMLKSIGNTILHK